MTIHTIIGTCLILAALLSLVGLVLHGRWRINRIFRTGPRSARMILRGMDQPDPGSDHE